MTQQIFRQQNADDVVFITIYDREARVRGFNHKWNEFFRRLTDVDDIHLRARIMISRTCRSETCNTPSIMEGRLHPAIPLISGM